MINHIAKVPRKFKYYSNRFIYAFGLHLNLRKFDFVKKYKKKYKKNRLVLNNRSNYKKLGLFLYYYNCKHDVYVDITSLISFDYHNISYNDCHDNYNFNKSIILDENKMNMRMFKEKLLSYATYDLLKKIDFILDNEFLL